MRKVGEILKDIEKLKSHCDTISGIANKMTEDNDVGRYVSDTFGVYAHTMRNMANDILVLAYRLESSLEECEVDIKM